MRKLLFNLHLVVALVFGVFIVLMGVTGSIMAFEQDFDRLIHWNLMHVQPQGQAMSLAQVVATVQKAHPGEKPLAYLLSTGPKDSYAVALPERLVFVDQYTGQILGEEKPGMDFLGFVHSLHLRLALMDKGRQFGEGAITASDIAALFLVITGAYLWWPTKRVRIDAQAKGRRFWFDVHNSLGILSLVFVLILICTGLVLGFEGATTAWFYKVTNSQPPARPKLMANPQPGQQPMTPDQVLDIARAAAPGAVPISMNAASGKQVYAVSMRYPEDRTPGGRTRVAVDPYTGTVPYKLDSRTGPGGYKLVNLNRAIHTGDVFGYASKTVMSLASLIMALQLVTGVVMWLKRRAAEKRAVRSVPEAATA